MPYKHTASGTVFNSFDQERLFLAKNYNAACIEGTEYHLAARVLAGIVEYVAPELAPPTTEQIIQQLTSAVQQHLDTTARTRNYDGILSACTYVSSTNTQFAAEGQACVVWRDGCWSKCYAVMTAVQQGLRGIPTEAELLAELPLLVW